jgi:replication-associated recombination protein RarA
MRNSDPDAAVYWVARMLEAGEDPLYIARRLVGSPRGRRQRRSAGAGVAVAAKDAAHFHRHAEGQHALAQAAIYLATAPKSNAVYTAYNGAAPTRIRRRRPVPLHLRNAPTKLMKQLDYGKGYEYAHNERDAVTGDGLPAGRHCAQDVLRAHGSGLREGDQTPARAVEKIKEQRAKRTEGVRSRVDVYYGNLVRGVPRFAREPGRSRSARRRP